MDGAHDIADSTDWISTPLFVVAQLEHALHCQICKEFYDTPMITSCSHTFCSRCIRTSLSADGRCPACRASDQASKLRNNWQLQEVVAAFQVARAPALKLAREEREQASRPTRSGKRKRAVTDPDDVAQAADERRTTRSKSRRLAASQTSEPEAIEIDDSDGNEDGDFEPERVPNGGLVQCPLGCGKRMKIEAVEPHLDRCEDEQRQESRAKSRTPASDVSIFRPPSRANARPQERISELNYSLMKDNALRKKFEELSIPSWGPKQLLVKRHTEWVNIWNANCDSSHSRTKRHLLQDLDTWERTQGGRAPHANSLPNGIMRKDFDGAGWQSQNKDEFSRLIADARRKKNNPETSSSPPKDSEEPSPPPRPALDGTESNSPYFAPPPAQAPAALAHHPSKP